MNQTFEQPKHLTVVCYHRTIRIVWPAFKICGIILSVMLLIGLWLRAAAGEHIATWRWIAAGGVGFLMAGLIRLSLLSTRSQRRYIEFRSDKIFLSQRGCVAFHRFIGWSFSPDSIEPRYTYLQLIYKFGFGRKRWEMLLDDEVQISALRQALTTQIPQK